jgi:hypothetical protein
MCPRLAARAVIGVPGIDIISLYSADHSLSAAATRFPASRVHPVLLPACQLPGGGLLGTVGVRQEKLPSQVYHGVGIDLPDRGPGSYPQQEAHLRLVHVPDPDDEPLQLGNSYYPSTIVQNLKIMNPADIKEGTDQILEDLGYIPTRYEDEITWRMPTPDETEKLIMAAGTPVAAC